LASGVRAVETMTALVMVRSFEKEG